MKSYFTILVSAMLLIGVGVNAQTALPKGQSQLNFGVGFAPKAIPVYFGFDHAIHNNITLGLEGSFRGYNERWRDNDYKRNVFGFLGNANYHFNTLLGIPSNFDFYAGLNVGFYAWADGPRDYDGKNISGLGLGAQVGGRYFFNKKVGINLEVGGGEPFYGGKFGLTVKL